MREVRGDHVGAVQVHMDHERDVRWIAKSLKSVFIYCKSMQAQAALLFLRLSLSGRIVLFLTGAPR